MIKQIYELESYHDFIEQLKEDPHYSDPHYLYAPDTLLKVFERDNRNVYAVFENDEVIGIFVVMVLPMDYYLEMLIGYSKEEQAYQELLNLMKQEYPGYQMDFVFNPMNDAIRNVLSGYHAHFDAEQMRMIADKPSAYKRRHHIELLSDKYTAQYCTMHIQDTFWTAEKVLQAKERFKVFVAIDDNKVIGFIDVTYCFKQNEPYDVQVDDAYRGKDIEADLLSYALEQNYPNTMMVLVDVNQKAEIEIYEKVGFKPIVGQNSVTATIQQL